MRRHLVKKTPKRSEAASFVSRVLTIIQKIPCSKILTYGQVATIAGSPRASRIVGGILFRQGPDSDLPWQRVINRQGKISTYRVGSGERQRALLEREGIQFRRDGSIDMKKHQWWPTVKQVASWKLKSK